MWGADRSARRAASALMRASLMPRSQRTRAAWSSARVRCRTGIMTPRFCRGAGVKVGSVSVPVGTASAGKYRLPPGLVVYVCPVGDAHTTVPSGSWRSRQPSELV